MTDDQQAKNSYRQILKYMGLFGSIQGLTILVGLVRNKLVAVILGPGGMGLISLFNSTITLISNATNLGLPVSSVKNLSEVYEEGESSKLHDMVTTVRTISFTTAILGFLVCLIFSTLLDRFTFSWGNHALHFALLSPAVAMMAITGGETAILKSVRQMRPLTQITILHVVVALFTSVPIYWFFGEAGIVPSLVIFFFAQMVLTCYYTYRLFPPRLRYERRRLLKGLGMIKLGIAFTISGIFTSGAEFLIRSFLNNHASLLEVGLYNAGFMLTTVYAGMVFTAMETDYFPRLSGVNKDVAACNLMINRQIEVTLLLITPMLLAFMIFMPLVVPILYTSKFMPCVPMAQVIVLALYLRAMKLPVAYLTLAKADSKIFLVLEAYSSILMVAAVILGYHFWGLEGAGWGLFVTGLVDIIVIWVFAHFHYKYEVSPMVLKYATIELPLAIAGFFVTRCLGGVSYWVLGVVLVLVSLAVSVEILRRKTSLWKKLKQNLAGRFKR